MVVVDMQNAFCDPAGTIFVPEAEQQLPLLLEAVRTARAASMPVIYTTVLWGSAEDVPLGIRKTDPGWETRWSNEGSPAVGRWGAEIALDGAPLDGETVLSKTGFICPGLADAALGAGLTTVFLTGTTANNCVYAAALSLFEAGLDVAAIDDCISGFGEPMKQPWLENIAMFLGRIVSFDDFRSEVDNAARNVG
ncbi:MAG TPA: isochorismatase family cysteine hydrolase [Gaiellaceae bacterium]